jgi:patatin-related protein
LREKELRIALVCFGGVSLAVYMHGITKEILKLVRASAALHGITDRTKRPSAGFFDARDPSDPEYDTESFYFELLREVGRESELRVVVDIIAGASSGGINGALLGRALSHDLPVYKLRDLWLQNSDVTELLDPKARARGWSKWFLRPLFWAADFAGVKLIQDPEVRSKLSLFMRSRWFEPPLDGMKMAALMYDAMLTMGAPRAATSSLLPSGQDLDLFVTVTDFYGSHQLMQIHDPPIIHEREHRHVLHFRYHRHASGGVDSDFDLASAPALAFAARATSSIPGAFPPARILEIDQLLHARGHEWPRRSRFLARNFAQYARVNVDVASIPFVDGGVLNNRPFREAITAIRGRPAYREVDRRIVYIDPNPAPAGSRTHHSMPSFFTTLKGALSDIPLTEPVTDELTWIARFNERARRIRAIIESARPHISQLIAQVMESRPAQPVNEDQVRRWREQANTEAARDAGFAYEAYVCLKLASARAYLTKAVMDVRGVQPDSPFARAIAEVIDAWAIAAGASYEPTGDPSVLAGASADHAAPPKWVAFLLAFDVDYRKRRLRFLIEGQNRIYQQLGSEGFEDLDAAAVDQLKRKFYDLADALEHRIANVALDAITNDLIEDIFRSGPSPAEAREITAYAQSFAVRHKDKLDRLIERLRSTVDLDATTRDLDVLLSKTASWPSSALTEVLVNYLGFSFWDVLTFPMMPWGEAGEFNEIRVDRISARDAVGIAQLETFTVKGAAFNQFAAFLSRAYRENDYLLGRLHAVDRLIDIVCDAAGSAAPAKAVTAALKRRVALKILDVEEQHLPTCAAMISELRATIAASS